ncbi:MAG: hypothetical protein RRC34_15755 [Lentisphaeria bacterium]|nr:hypothetical protein [Lentisphaeria bacterium]
MTMAQDAKEPRALYDVAPWSVVESSFSSEAYPLSEGVLALSNGYLGVRSSFEEGLCFSEGMKGHYAADVFNARPRPTVITLPGCPENPREIVNLPDFTCLRIFVNGDPVDMGYCDITSYTRALHMDQGVITRRVELTTPGGVPLSLSSTRFVCRCRPHVAAFQLSLCVSEKAADVSIEAGIDGRVTNRGGYAHLCDLAPTAETSGRSVMLATTCERDVEVAVLTHDELSPMESVCDASSEKNAFAGLWFEGRLTRNVPVIFTRIAAVATSRESRESGAAFALAREELGKACAAGFDHLLAEQQEAWLKVWAESDVSLDIDSDDSAAIQQGVRYALFQLFQHTAAARPVGSRGLICERASGGCSWDMYTAVLPGLALLRPEEAKEIVFKLIARLPAAQAKSAEMGLKGAKFPWRSGPEGEETCPLWQFSLTGLHVTAGLAWGVWFTYRTTRDIALLTDGGMDVLMETARFWASRVYRHQGSDTYELRSVTGFGEYHQDINNDFYTNAMARWNLRIVTTALTALEEANPTSARQARERLNITSDELDAFEEIAANMLLPFNHDKGLSVGFDGEEDLEPVVIPELALGHPLDEIWTFDRLGRSHVLRRSGVIAAQIFLADCGDLEQRRRDFDYYTPITTHDSALSMCHHSIAAAQIGKIDDAEALFHRIVRLDLENIPRNSQLGPHISCLTAIWQSIIHGFLGMPMHADIPTIAPHLPVGWKKIQTSITCGTTRLNILAEPGQVTLSANQGHLEVIVWGETVLVGESPITVMGS